MNLSIGKKNIRGKKVVLRVDLNSPIKDGKIINNERISESAKSINFFLKKGCRVIVLSHQGRKGKEDFTSLKEHSKFLNKYVKIKFVEQVFGEKSKMEINNLKNSEAILLENVRFEDEEADFKKFGAKYVSEISKICDIYVNDAFSVSHREQASIVLFPEYLPSYIGPNFDKELKALLRIKMKNVLYILGGSKPEENSLFLIKGRKVICGGIFGQMCLRAKGFDFGRQNSFLDEEKVKKLKLKIRGVNCILPEDFAVNIEGKRVEFGKDKFPTEYEIFDIGKNSVEIFTNEIKKASSVFMKGPFGYIEDDRFSVGTEKILKAIVESNAFSVLGGGHLSSALSKMKIDKKRFGHISLSGGALASFVAGEKLPGLEAIKKSKK